MLVCVFFCAACTRDRGCSAHPVFPAPSALYEGGNDKSSGGSRRENADAYPHRCLTIESEVSPRHCEERSDDRVRRSSTSEGGSNPCFSERIDGLLRFARNDAERAAPSANPTSS